MKPPERSKVPPAPLTPEERNARERGLKRLKEIAESLPRVTRQPFPKLPIVN